MSKYQLLQEQIDTLEQRIEKLEQIIKRWQREIERVLNVPVAMIGEFPVVRAVAGENDGVPIIYE